MEAEVEQFILRRGGGRPVAGRAPAAVEWSLDIPPYEVDPGHPIVTTMLDASAAAGEPSRLSGLDSWFDAASFTRFGGTPCDRLGPARHRLGAHRSTSTCRSTTWCAAPRAWRSPPCATAGWPSDAWRTPGLATAADAALVSKLLRAFFSHEGREVEHLRQNVEAILDDPGRGFFTLAGDRGGGDDHHPHLGRRRLQRRDRGDLGAAVGPRPGPGRHLLRSAVAECRRRGIESIELRVTPDDQEIGIPTFYTKQGFPTAAA